MDSKQRRRQDLETLSDWALENGADSRSLIMLLKEIATSCVDEGVLSEKVCMKTDTGTVEVVERFPAISVSAIGLIHKIVQDAQKELDKEPPPDTVVNLVISRRRLEDV